MNVFAQLNDPSIALPQRLALAWRVLHDEASDPGLEDRVAAKCWLTYRITEGEVELDRWPDVERVQPRYNGTEGLQLRWRISQLTAEMYLHGLARHHRDDLIFAAMCIQGEAAGLNRWPPCLLNWLRASCVCALMESDRLDRGRLVEEAIHTWQDVMGGVFWTQWPMRFVELRDDLGALWQLIAIGKRCGLVDYKPFSWLPKICGGGDLFGRLMRSLNAPQL